MIFSRPDRWTMDSYDADLTPTGKLTEEELILQDSAELLASIQESHDRSLSYSASVQESEDRAAHERTMIFSRPDKYTNDCYDAMIADGQWISDCASAVAEDSEAIRSMITRAEENRLSYAESMERDEDRAAHERMLFRTASELHHRLTTDGGYSYAPGRSLPASGFLVGSGRHELRVRTVTVETVFRFLLAHHRYVLGRDSRFFGGWTDGGYVYLDTSQHFVWRADAKAAAVKRRELAVYSIHEGKSIPTDEL